MKKLYKKTFHAVIYAEQKYAEHYGYVLFNNLNQFCGLSETKLEEITCLDDLPEAWEATDSPTTEINPEAEEPEDYFQIHPLTIKEILDESRLNSLEEENKKLTEENQKLHSLLKMLKIV